MKYDWNDFNKFSDVFDEYLPTEGEGETKATQISTAISKLVYKWFNDGDIFDNTHELACWCENISSYANWLYNYIPGTQKILDRINICHNSDDYTSLLYDLCAYLEGFDLEDLDKEEKVSSVYDLGSPFTCIDYDEDEDYDDYEDEDEDEEYDEEEEDF